MSDNPLQDLVQRTASLSRQFPVLNQSPGVLTTVAQQPDPAVSQQSASAISAFSQGVQLQNQLDALPGFMRYKAWQALTPAQQNVLQNGLNYSPPTPDNSLWHKAIFGVGHLLASAGKDVGSALSTVLGPGLRAGQHLYRTTVAIEEDAAKGGSLWSPKVFAAGFDLHNWAKAWQETTNGQAYIPQAQKFLTRYQSQLPTEQWNIAIDAAKGDNYNMLLGKYGQQATDAAMGNPDWGRTQQILDAAHASVGRRWMETLNEVPGLGALIADPGQKTKLFGVAGPTYEPFKFYSGVGDALADIYLLDPLRLTAPVEGSAAAAIQARYLVTSGQDVERLAASSGAVRRAFGRIANYVQADNFAAIGNEFPKMQPLLQDMATYFKTGTKDVAGVTDFFSGQAALEAGLDGQAGKYLPPLLGQQVPHLTAVGPVRLVAKNALDWVIQQAKDLPSLQIPGTGLELNLIKRAGRFASQMALLYKRFPDGFDPLAPDAAEKFTEVARLSLPRVQADRLLNAFLQGDIGQKRNIYLSMINDVFHKMGSDYIAPSASALDEGVTGLDATTPLGIYHQRLLGEINTDLVGRPYTHTMDGSVGSLVDRAGDTPLSVGVMEHQLTQTWALPNMTDIANAQRSMTMMGKMATGLHIDGLMTKFLPYWKGTTLARPGFPLRVAGEEAMRQILDEGFVPFLKAKLAASAVRAAARDTVIPDIMLPMRDYLATRIYQLAREAKLAFVGREYVQEAEQAIKTHGLGMLPSQVGASAHAYADDPSIITKSFKDRTGALHPITFKASGEWQDVHPFDDGGVINWQRELQRNMNDRSFQIAMEHPGDLEGATNAVYDYLASDAAATVRSKAAIFHLLTEEGMSEDQALRDWANRMAQNAFSLTHTPAGEPIDAVTQALAGGSVPGVEDLKNLPIESRPRFVSGPELIPVHQNVVSAILDKGFRKVIDPTIDAISRQPMYIQNRVAARRLFAKQYQILKDMGVPNADEIANEWVTNKAISDMLPNIHNPAVRNQYEQLHPTLMPFWFAQEQFLKRWGRTLLTNPYAARRAQLLMMGLRNAGVLTKDQNGDDTFVYPGTGALSEILQSAGSLIFGKLRGDNNLLLPVNVPMTGKIKYISPGLSEGAQPSVGPFVAFGLSALRGLWPEFVNPVTKAVEGEQAVGRSPWEAFVPSVVDNLYKVLTSQPENNAQMTSAMLQAMQQLDAAGHGLPENADATQQQVYIDRVRQWARVQLGLRAMLGFAGPTAPQLQFAGSLTPELLGLMKALPFDEALAEFQRRHPDATAYTVFQSTLKPGAQRPTDVSAAAGQWLDKYGAFARKYGAAATWFLPNAPGNFDQSTWNTELAMQMRVRRTPQEFWQQTHISADAQAYYNMRDDYEKMRAGTADAAQRSQMDQVWQQWKESFLATRPLFAADLAGGASRVSLRQTTLAQVASALEDPAAPQQASNAPLAQMVQGYYQMQDMLTTLKGRRDSAATTQRQDIQTAFVNWAKTFTDPTAINLFNQLIRPDLPEPQQLMGGA